MRQASSKRTVNQNQSAEFSSPVDHVHGSDVVEKVGDPEDEVVVENVEPVVDDVIPAVEVHVQSAPAGYNENSKTSAPIGARKSNSPHFSEIMTDRATNIRTGGVVIGKLRFQ